MIQARVLMSPSGSTHALAPRANTQKRRSFRSTRAEGSSSGHSSSSSEAQPDLLSRPQPLQTAPVPSRTNVSRAGLLGKCGACGRVSWYKTVNMARLLLRRVLRFPVLKALRACLLTTRRDELTYVACLASVVSGECVRSTPQPKALIGLSRPFFLPRFLHCRSSGDADHHHPECAHLAHHHVQRPGASAGRKVCLLPK